VCRDAGLKKMAKKVGLSSFGVFFEAPLFTLRVVKPVFSEMVVLLPRLFMSRRALKPWLFLAGRYHSRRYG
jgi:hypothetical protein